METRLTDQEFELFKNLIYNQSGIHFSSTNRSVLENRLRERLRSSQPACARDYYDLILNDELEMRNFLDSVTTNLTRFFRNAMHLQTLENYVIPELAERKKHNQLRIWSAGCSTGEEPYTIAIIMRDKMDARFRVEIVGSDLSLKSLMVAREGFYSKSRMWLCT